MWDVGQVIAIEGNDAWVRLSAQTGCGRCDKPGGCGGNTLNRVFLPTYRDYRFRNTVSAHPGQFVRVTMSCGGVWKSAWRVYGIPVFFMLLVTLLCARVNSSDGAIALSASAGLVLGILISVVLNLMRPLIRPQLSTVLHGRDSVSIC